MAAGLTGPRPASAGIVSATCGPQPDNLMRFDCDVQTSAPTTSWRVGVRPTAGGPWRWFPWRAVADTEQALWNFKPGVPMTFAVQTDDLAWFTAALGTPSLPAGLSELTLSLRGDVGPAGNPTWRTRFVLLDTDECSGGKASYLVAVNTFRDPGAPFVSWYHDIEAATGILDADVHGTEIVGDDAADGILVIVDHRHLYQFGWDGQTIRHKEYPNCDGGASSYGPCPHHAAANTATGETVVVTASIDRDIDPSDTTSWATCDPDHWFVNHGVEVLGPLWIGGVSYALHTDFADTPYDPTVYEGPAPENLPPACDTPYFDTVNAEGLGTFSDAGEIDWTHMNAVHPYSAGGIDYLLVSLKDFDEIALLASTPLNANQADWVLNGNDLLGRTHNGVALDLVMAPGITGLPQFSDQHDLRTEQGMLQFLDNNNDPSHTLHSRVLRVDPHPAIIPPTAVIEASFVVTDYDGEAQDCPAQGSARVVPGTGGDHVLALCQGQRMAVELNDGTGNDTTPALMELRGVCQSGANPMGWYRSFPLVSLGGQ